MTEDHDVRELTCHRAPIEHGRPLGITPRRFRVCALLCLFALRHGPYAQAEEQHTTFISESPELERALDVIHAPYMVGGVPGSIVAVLREGKVVYLGGYGLANREHNVPWTPQTGYTFFSLTKPMVAVAFLTLQDQGRLSLDQPIQDFLPDFPRYAQPVTIRHLLTHTSGIWQDEQLVQLVAVSTAEGPISLDELYGMTKRQPSLPYRPGSYFYYNDGGMRIAARILERVTGQSLFEALRELVFQPAGMRTARIKPTEPMYFPNQATAYLLDRIPGTDPRTGALMLGNTLFENSGDGAGNGSILDLVGFANYLSAPRAAGSYLDRLSGPVDYRPGEAGGYRMCLQVRQHRGIQIVSHSGYQGKEMAYLRDLDVWIIYMRNALDYSRKSTSDYLDDLIDAVLSSFPEYRHFLDASNPAHDVKAPNAPPQGFTDDEIRALSGRYIEPISGYPLSVEPEKGRLYATIFGQRAELVRAAPEARRYRTYEFSMSPLVNLSVEGVGALSRVSLRYTDWERPRPLHRVGAAELQASQTLRTDGIYRSRDFGVTYLVEPIAPNALRLTIGSGFRYSDVYQLERVSGEVFEGSLRVPRLLLDFDLVVRFTGAGGHAERMLITTDRIRGLELERIADLQTARTPSSH